MADELDAIIKQASELLRVAGADDSEVEVFELDVDFVRSDPVASFLRKIEPVMTDERFSAEFAGSVVRYWWEHLIAPVWATSPS